MTRDVIFAVDDEPHNLELYRRTLTQYELWPFQDAQTALAAALRTSPTCVIVDYRMPGTNGVELVKLARINGYEGPVIMVTAFSDLDEIVYAEQANLLYRVIPKPIRPDYFREQVALAVDDNSFRKKMQGTRRFPRFPMRLKVRVEVNGGWEELETVDASLGGLLLDWHPTEMPEQARMQLAADETWFETKVRLARAAPEGTAVELLDPSEDFRRALGEEMLAHRFESVAKRSS